MAPCPKDAATREQKPLFFLITGLGRNKPVVWESLSMSRYAAATYIQTQSRDLEATVSLLGKSVGCAHLSSLPPTLECFLSPTPFFPSHFTANTCFLKTVRQQEAEFCRELRISHCFPTWPLPAKHRTKVVLVVESQHMRWYLAVGSQNMRSHLQVWSQDILPNTPCSKTL